jgi:hypothetical protein
MAAAAEQVAAVVETTALTAVRELKAELDRVRQELEEHVESLEKALSSLEILVIDRYFVKVWHDDERDVWCADCPTAKGVGPASDRDAIVADITTGIREMLEVLDELGQPEPEKHTAVTAA